MKVFLAVLVTILVIGGILYFVGANSQHTIPVLSQTAPYGNFNEYYLYVPGNKSTCTWTWIESSTPQSISTQPDIQTGQHNFLYNSTVSDVAVTCLSDQGIKYTGQF